MLDGMDASPTGRLLRLLSVLQTGRDHTGVELSDRLGVSVRTIRRDVGRLRELGYPVDASIGAIGGYRLVAGTAMPPLLLDDDEAVAIAVGLQTAATGMDEPAARALAKIEQVLPGRLRRRVEAVTAATEPLTGMHRGGTPAAPVVDPAVLATLATACRRDQRLRFAYAAKGGAEPARRHADPHRLVSADRRWYLVAYDLDRLDWRTFRADRVSGPEPTGARASEREPPGGDAATFVAESLTSFRARWRALVVLHTDIEDARERLPGGTGVLEEIDGGTGRSCLLITGGDALDWLAVRLMLLEVPLEVREPPELAAYMRELGRRMITAGGG